MWVDKDVVFNFLAQYIFMSLVFSIFIVQSNDSIYHLYIYILLHNIKTETFFQILDFQVKKFHDFWMKTKITDL